jgi:NADH-quinone oxidoreductase subunit M
MDFARLCLLGLLVVPLVSAVIVAMLGRNRSDTVRLLSLAAALLTLLLAALVITPFVADRVSQLEKALRTFQPEFVPGGTGWTLLRLGDTGVHFTIGLDGLNVWLVALTVLLMVPSVLVSWTSITERVNEFFAWLLALEAGMIGVFLAFDILLFYVFFELTLVPLFFLIGIWGGPERRHAARKFFIYTLAGSLITFVGVLGIVLACYSDTRRLTFSIPELTSLVNDRLAELHQWYSNNPGDWAVHHTRWQRIQFWVFLALIAGFAVKVPLVPLHTWLPLAHVEAPTAGSVLLAGVLLKIGAYGFIRLCLPLTPDACVTIGVPLVGWLSVIGIIYGAACALAQDDIKKLVAYSSVSHLGFCMLGMFALNQAGLTGSMLQMINHGLSTGALFLLVGMLYERYHTRLASELSGIGAKMKLLTVSMVFICLSSAGLPGLNGFIGEVLVLMGMYEFHGDQVNGKLLAVLAATGVVLGAWYLLTMLMRVFFGPLREPHHEAAVADLNSREVVALAPIAFLCVLLGVYPQPVIVTMQPELRLLTELQEGAIKRAEQSQEQARTREVEQ